MNGASPLTIRVAGTDAHPDEHQEGRPDGLGAQALEQIGLVKHAPCPFA